MVGEVMEDGQARRVDSSLGMTRGLCTEKEAGKDSVINRMFWGAAFLARLSRDLQAFTCKQPRQSKRPPVFEPTVQVNTRAVLVDYADCTSDS